MTEDLGSPLLANQIVMLEDATMRFEPRARFERNDEMFVTQAHKLGKVAVACHGCVGSYGHGEYITMRVT